MDYRNEINPPPLLKPLTTLDEAVNMYTSQSLIDPDKQEAYPSVDAIPKEDLEATLRTLRTIRNLALERMDYTTDINLTASITAVLGLISYHNKRESDAAATTSPSPNESPAPDSSGT